MSLIRLHHCVVPVQSADALVVVILEHSLYIIINLCEMCDRRNLLTSAAVFALASTLNGNNLLSVPE